MKSNTALILIMLLYSCVEAQSRVYKNYTMHDGLPSEIVYCAIQDHQGYMWFGTDAGACRFDGQHFQNFTTKDGLSDNEVLNLFEDSKGRLWFLTLNGKLCYFYQDHFYNAQNDSVLLKTRAIFEFSSCMEDNNKNLWFCGNGRQIIEIKNNGNVENFNFDTFNINWRRAWIYTYQPDSNEVWAITPKQLFRYSNGKFIESDNFLDPFFFYFHLQRSKNFEAFYFSTLGIYKLTHGKNEMLLSKDSIPEYNSIRKAFVDDERNIWVTTSNLKTLLIEKKSSGYGPIKEILPGTEIGQIFIDNEDNKWLCTIGHGVYQIQANARYIDINPYTGIKEEITSVAIDRSKNLSYGTVYGHIFYINNSGTYSEIILRNEENIKCRISDIEFDKSTSVWSATNYGVYRISIRNEKLAMVNRIPIEYAPHSYGLNFGAKKLKFDNAGKLYISMVSGIAVESQNEKYISYTTSDIPKKRTYCLFFDENNYLWFENMERLYRYDYRKLRSYANLDTEFHSQITDIEGLSDSTLAISTYGSGIKFFKDGKIINRLDHSNGLAGDLCRKIYVDSDRVYVATTQGVSYFTYNNGRVFNLKTITTSDGIVSNDIKDICASGSKVYLATSSGLCVVDKRISQSKSFAPPVYFTSIDTRDSLYEMGENIVLHYRSDLNIGYIGITFEQPEKLLYEYRLNNEGNEWIETENTSLNFSSLSSGDYHLELRAKKHNSDWSDPVALEFKVLSPFWQRWWFAAIVVVVIIAISLFIFRVISARQFAKQEIRIRQQQMLSEERARISSDMHDDLGADLSNLLLLARLSGRNVNLPDENKKNLSRLELFARDVIDKVDEIIWSLSPSNDSIKDLIRFIADYFNNVVQLNSFTSTVRFPDVIPDKPISAVIRRNVFLVVKECLHNVVKHSEAETVSLDIYFENDKMHLIIEDNGKGFKSEEGKNGADGLFNINKRIVEVEGGLHVNSGLGTGTRISFWVPLGLAVK